MSLSVFYPARNGYAVPAIPAESEIRQPDGRFFSARLWGDEKSHGWETFDGYTIIQNPRTQYWCYAKIDATDGRLTAGSIVGFDSAVRPARKHLRSEDAGAKDTGPIPMSDFTRRGANAQRRNPENSPVAGTRGLVVLLVNFSDTAAEFSGGDFERLLFGSGNNSLKDYYQEVSYGALTLTSGSAGVTGWYTAAFPHDDYGWNNTHGWDDKAATLVREAVAAADDAVDFSEYDLDGDCYVDTVVVVHQGSGEEAGGRSTDIWSHRWRLSSAAYYGDGGGVYTTNDVSSCGRIKVDDYIIQPEILFDDIQTIGVFAHEYGHILGLPDLYDTDGTSSGIGDWGVMGSGSWNKVACWGDSPAHPSAWSKYALGWVSPVEVETEFVDEAISPAALEADVYQLFPNAQHDRQEFFLVENRQRIGFDAGLPGSGLAIWHVDEDMNDGDNKDNTQECTPDQDCRLAHYHVGLVQADGYWDLERKLNRGDGGDLYPGQLNNTAFHPATEPSSLIYDGTSSRVGITDIVESGTTISATLSFVSTITPETVGGGCITPGSSTVLRAGESLTFRITPDSGFYVHSVSVDGQSLGAVSEYTFSEDRFDHEISAEFLPISGDGSGDGAGCFIATLL